MRLVFCMISDAAVILKFTIVAEESTLVFRAEYSI